MKLAKNISFIFLLLFIETAGAVTYFYDFSDLQTKDSAALIWNFQKQELHPPLKVYQYRIFADPTLWTRNYDVGDGSDGSFNVNTYVNFSSGGDLTGNIIRINTDEHPELQFTDFELLAGWTIRPEGSGHLVIRSLSSIIIRGVIDCSGEAGEEFTLDPSVRSAGGASHCGGGAGGDGSYLTLAGSLTVAAEDGEVGGDLVPDGVALGTDGPTAGKGAIGIQSGGGGGASYTPSQGVGLDASAGEGGTGGGPGDPITNQPDYDFQYTGGGFGGGGGSLLSVGAPGQNSSGGGGGAGGGVIEMTAVDDIIVYSTGSVLANGGSGGGSIPGVQAGGGGGGGGGSIMMFAGLEVQLGGPVEALGGIGGGDVGSRGGIGSVGRTWLVGVSGYAVGVGADPLVAENPYPLLDDVGTTKYQTGIFTASSKAVDLLSTRPDILDGQLVGVTSLGSTLTLEVATGESSNFTPSVWLDPAVLSGPQSRYMKFRVTINNLDSNTPAKVSSLSLDYSKFKRSQFNFAGGCGSIKNSGESKEILWFLWPLIFSILLRFYYHLYPRRSQLSAP